MKKTIEFAEAIVGRKLNKIERQLFDLFKDDDRYSFQRDEIGFLKAVSI